MNIEKYLMWLKNNLYSNTEETEMVIRRHNFLVWLQFWFYLKHKWQMMIRTFCREKVAWIGLSHCQCILWNRICWIHCGLFADQIKSSLIDKLLWDWHKKWRFIIFSNKLWNFLSEYLLDTWPYELFNLWHYYWLHM